MYDELFFKKSLVNFVGEREANTYELKKLGTEYSTYYTTEECFEIIVFVSRRFQHSPWPFGFVRKSKENILHCILNTETKAKNNQEAKTNASKDFLFFKEETAKQIHTKINGIKTVFASLSVQLGTPQVIKTPTHLLDKLNCKYAFDFDPCPIEPTHDAMLINWGRTNYINPPFKHAHAFVAKAVEQAIQYNNKSVVLIPVPITSGWFSRVLESHCIKKIIFLRSGLKFDGYKNRCPLALCLIEIQRPATIVYDNNYVRLETGFWDPVQDTVKRQIKTHKTKCFLT